jgi:hypothetical protein
LPDARLGVALQLKSVALNKETTLSETIDPVVDERRERFFNRRTGDIPWVRDEFPSDKKCIDAFHCVGACSGQGKLDLTLALIRHALFQETGTRSERNQASRSGSVHLSDKGIVLESSFSPAFESIICARRMA